MTLYAPLRQAVRVRAVDPEEAWLRAMDDGLIVNCALLFNAAGWPLPPSGSFLMLAISWNLFGFFAQFAESVNFFFEKDEI